MLLNKMTKGLAIGAIVVSASAFSACALDHRTDASLNQLPYNVRTVVERQVGTGTIEEVEAYSDDGMVYYEVEYEKYGEDFELRIDDTGKILAKTED